MNDIKILLPKVREQILRERAMGNESFGLSWLVSKVTPFDEQFHMSWQHQNPRKKFTSGSPKATRGKVQRCLTFLAVSGIVYTRRGPEGAVAPYAHGETDKRFRIRYTQAQAINALKRLGIKT